MPAQTGDTMINLEDAKDAEPLVWLELANGGGLLLRDPNEHSVPQPRYSRQRPQKQLPEGSRSTYPEI
jgi:hypothetical protein